MATHWEDNGASKVGSRDDEFPYNAHLESRFECSSKMLVTTEDECADFPRIYSVDAYATN